MKKKVSTAYREENRIWASQPDNAPVGGNTAKGLMYPMVPSKASSWPSTTQPMLKARNPSRQRNSDLRLPVSNSLFRLRRALKAGPSFPNIWCSLGNQYSVTVAIARRKSKTIVIAATITDKLSGLNACDPHVKAALVESLRSTVSFRLARYRSPMSVRPMSLSSVSSRNFRKCSDCKCSGPQEVGRHKPPSPPPSGLGKPDFPNSPRTHICTSFTLPSPADASSPVAAEHSS
mmetsp:Transcript_2120/g.4106  ORF Transcript_2120/g.4106 Transcript_2120/m.4106 type:complete len:233 (-) Transcript_2120:207-905(-)